MDLFRGTKRATKSGERRVLEIGVHAQYTVHTSMKVTLHSAMLGMVTTQDEFFYKKIAKSQAEKNIKNIQGLTRDVKLCLCQEV